MDEAVKRQYDNAGRAARAAENRVAVLEAGHAVLVERGYSGATMAAIARAAGVSVETVYKAFGSKSELVWRVLDHAIVGDDAPVALAERSDVRTALEAARGPEILTAFAEASCRILERAGPLLGVLLVAARAGESELREIADEAGRRRLVDYTRVVEAVAATGDLHPDLGVAEAADTLWAVGSPEVHQQLCVDRGWSLDRYRVWLIRSSHMLLLR